MKAVGYKVPLPISHPESLLDIELPKPLPGPRDLLVRIEAVSVNPADTKQRARTHPFAADKFRVVGYDAAGVVESIGREVSFFKPGDEVWYAGSILRQGTNAEYHLVDERIVGLKPKTFDFVHAAALPLTAITAWELLFDRLRVLETADAANPSILIIGGAGGVGSILTQFARQLTPLRIISTASSPQSVSWCRDLGAHFIVDHTKPFLEQMQRLEIPEVNYIAALTASDSHYPAMIDVLAPEGAIGMIDDPPQIDVKPLKDKSASFHWEFMFARSKYGTKSMARQHELLNEVAGMVDRGQLRTTVGEVIGTINAANLKRAHAMVESGKTRGKIVLAGF